MMNAKLLSLPVGIQSFELLRRDSLLYVDKTARLQELVTDVRRCFLSRPRRFGKSLTLSTLEAMFSGKTELFKGLAAEAWVAEQARHPCPVLCLSMARGRSMEGVRGFDISLYNDLMVLGRKQGLPMLRKDTEGALGAFKDVLEGLYDQGGPVVVLIDEYDKPILDKIGDLEAAEAMREALRSFYTVLKGCDKYIRFLMIVGISVCPKCPTLRTDAADRHSAGRLSGARELAAWPKTGVFSAMNNLRDISASESFGDIVGYTQAELEASFSEWIDAAALKTGTTREGLLKRMKDYYDGFCFDGATRLYNPFSILNFLADRRFSNYWYSSGSPAFIVEYMKRHGIRDPEAYRHMSVSADFAESQEIERARPESFLYQAGYLTIEKWVEDSITLDYPNREVLDSISRMYLEHVYRVESYSSIGSDLWRALSEGDVAEAIRLYNTALASIPYQDFIKRDESLYRSLFLMLLRGAGITAHGEVPTNRGRSDVLVLFPHRVAVLEFKLARSESEVDRLRLEGRKQIEEKGYTKPYDAERRAVTAEVVVIDAEKRRAVPPHP